MPTIPSQFECNICENRHCYLKRFCEPQWIELLSSAKYDLRFSKGETIFHEGAEVPGIYFIKKGKIKVISNTVPGEERIIRLAKAGDILGHRGIGDATFPIGAKALEDAELCLIQNDVLNEIFITNPWLTVELMMFYSRELRKSEFRSKHLHHMTEQEKLALVLLYIEETFGEETEEATEIPLSRKELAQLSGSPLPEINNELNLLKEKGIIEQVNERMVLHSPEELRTIIHPYPPIF